MGNTVSAEERKLRVLGKQEREKREEVVEGEGGVAYSQYRYTDDEIVEVIKGTGGIIATIAARLGVSWTTAKNYVEKIEDVRIAYEAECETVNDRAVSVVINSINSGHVGNAKWWLARMRKNKFSTKQEVSFDGDIDLRRLSDAELEAIIQAESEG